MDPARVLSFRYRVADIEPAPDGGGDPVVSNIIEYRDFDMARDRAQARTAAGQPTVVQVGVLLWLPHADAEAAVRHLVADGFTVVAD